MYHNNIQFMAFYNVYNIYLLNIMSIFAIFFSVPQNSTFTFYICTYKLHYDSIY
jgi:hypothetical protein